LPGTLTPATNADLTGTPDNPLLRFGYLLTVPENPPGMIPAPAELLFNLLGLQAELTDQTSLCNGTRFAPLRDYCSPVGGGPTGCGNQGGGAPVIPSGRVSGTDRDGPKYFWKSVLGNPRRRGAFARHADVSLVGRPRLVESNSMGVFEVAIRNGGASCGSDPSGLVWRGRRKLLSLRHHGRPSGAHHKKEGGPTGPPNPATRNRPSFYLCNFP